MVRARRLAVLLVLLVVALPTGAQATFHFMSISELGAGFLGDPNIQFVELRLDSAGQTHLTNTRLTSFDKDGFPTALLLTGQDVTDGSAGRNVLYATAEFQAATGIAPDFVIPTGIVGPTGMVCWGAPSDNPMSPPDPGTWDANKPENYVDCVAYGAYPHTTRPQSGPPTNVGPGDGANSLTRTKNTSVTGSNDTDFALAVPSPCNNADQCAVLMPTPGKAQLACRRAIVKATNRFAGIYVQALVGCETLRLTGKLAGPCPDAKAATKIAKAETKIAKVVTKACDGLAVADTGFGATCPGFTGGCTAPITTTADVVTCLGCIAGRAGDELQAALYAAPPDPALVKCQLTLGKITTRFARAATTLLAQCEERVARGKLAPPCPDAKTAARLVAKETKVRSGLCRACGGKDKLCDGVTDATPATLGITTCPTRTVPGGAACEAIAIHDLGDVVACAACLASFESRCVTALSAHPGASPAACR